VKDNKEECLALGNHARELTSKLLIHLESRDDLDPMTSIIKSFVKYVIGSPKRLRSSLHRRTLEDIKDFTRHQAERSSPKQWLRKQSDLNEIKEWDTVLMRAFECFHVATSPTLLGVRYKLTELSIDRCSPPHSGRCYCYQGRCRCHWSRCRRYSGIPNENPRKL
jgi:hypothetical protein